MSKSKASEIILELQTEFFENILDALSFTDDTSASHKKLKAEKELVITYLEVEKPKEYTDVNKLIESIRRHTKKIERYPNLVYSMAYVYSIAHFESFFTSVLKILFLNLPQGLSTSKKSLTYEEILKFLTTEDLKNYLLEKELIEISFKSIFDQFSYLDTKFNIKFNHVVGESTFDTKDIDIEKVVEIFSIRNIILHNNGIINNKFLKDNPNSNYNIGEKVKLDNIQVEDCIMFLLKIGHKVANRISAKISKI